MTLSLSFLRSGAASSPIGVPLAAARHGVDDRYGGGPRLIQEISQRRGDLGADLLGIIAAGIEVEHQYSGALALEGQRLRLGPVRTFLRPSARGRQRDPKKKQSGS